MKTLKSQLQNIIGLTNSINAINQDYSLGLLTPTEFTSQLQVVLIQIDAVRKSIRDEYEINDNAINLMLMLN